MTQSTELRSTPAAGWAPLGLWFLALVGVIAWFAVAPPILKGLGILGVIALVIALCGFFIVNPNMSRVLVLFGKYKGSVRQDGFFYVNPFMSKAKISLRSHNLDGTVLKVNDLLGNPIEISAVVVWRVADTARAAFDVEDYAQYVKVQSEAAVRSVASSHPYDDSQHDNVLTTLRGSTDEVTEELKVCLQQRFDEAGIEVIEARINHLAYAPEIASAMLQRQQAGAIIAARHMIVTGAVGMVEDALRQIQKDGVIQLDEERKATLVGNLLVVLCGQSHVQPVLNAGSLYN
jgi:regulator of protease activity HflC (stomatin/prohibitin superfamily)